MDPVVACFGRMTLQKGQDLLVEAIPMILASYPETRFIISGDGPTRDHVVQMARDNGVYDSCIFLNAVPRHDYVDLMKSIDILALPSRNEPFGIVALEAWSAGKPVVATSAGGPREFIWHDVNGFLVDASAGGIAHGIGSLLADHEHCRALGANGRNAVEDIFNWDTVAEYTEGVYCAALSS
jgi:glycosyltransferase involved in cell wall biosynthesis